MAFIAEYIPPVEEETSDFLRKARKTLNTGWSRWNSWVVDRERDMVLHLRGSGRQPASVNQDYWFFMDGHRLYSAVTWLLSNQEGASAEVLITRSVGFQIGDGLSNPDTKTLAAVKEALCAFKDSGVSSRYRMCQLTLVDHDTGNVI